jgi:hypothetical protein
MNNVLTIIGAAAVDEKFLASLFEDPIGTARRYGFQLNLFERDALLELTNRKNPEIRKGLQHLYDAKICPRTPCPLALAPVDYGPGERQKTGTER